MAAFKFNLQQLDVLGAYDRYTKELEEQKKEELYQNKLVDQQVDDFTRYYNPNSLRENDKPLLQIPCFPLQPHKLPQHCR